MSITKMVLYLSLAGVYGHILCIAASPCLPGSKAESTSGNHPVASPDLQNLRQQEEEYWEG